MSVVSSFLSLIASRISCLPVSFMNLLVEQLLINIFLLMSSLANSAEVYLLVTSQRKKLACDGKTRKYEMVFKSL